MSASNNRHAGKDGGYGWVITAMCFLLGVMELGTVKSFGVFILPVRESLDCSVTALGTAMAASHAVALFLVPLVNIMTERFGPRPLTIAGGLVMSLSFGAIGFSPNLPVFSFFVILWGIGLAMAYNPPIAAMLFYFPTNSALPIGIALTGCALGIMVYPPLTELLIDAYGWRGAMLIFTAVNANICVFGALIKTSTGEYSALNDSADDTSHAEGTSHADDTTHADGTTHVDDTSDAPHERESRHCCSTAARGLCKVLSLDVLWNEPRFTVHVLAFFLFGIMYSAWMIYVVPNAITIGIDSQLATFLSTAGGIGSLIGRILYGPVLHMEFMTPVQMMILLNFTNMAAFFLDPVVFDNYPGLVCLAFVNGLSLGTIAGLVIPVAQEVLGKDQAIQGWGTVAVFFAMGEVTGGAFAGWVFETSGSYDVSFLTLGGLAAFNVLVLVVELRLLNRYTSKSSTNQSED